MNISHKLGWAAFLVALSGFSLPAEAATQNAPALQKPTENLPTATVSDRLSRISSTLKTKANQLPEMEENLPDNEIAVRWLNGGGGRAFANARRGGWGNGYGGGFANINPWRNGWGDGGGFLNRSWPNGGWRNGGGFFNRY